MSVAAITAAPSAGRLLGSWTFDPGVLTLLVAAATLYGLGVRRTPSWPPLRVASFLAGLLVLAFALLSGIDRYSELMLSVHMFQHLLLMLLAPILLLWGSPVRLALAASPAGGRRILGATLRQPWLRRVSQPAVGFTVFASVISLTHLTGLYEVALRDQFVHALEHAAYFWSGVLFLAPLVAADPLPHPPAPVARFSWLMGAMTAMAIPGALLTFQNTVRYPFYLAPAHALGRSALADQHLAGVVMWIGGGIAMFALAITVTLQAMLAEERRQQRRESRTLDPLGPLSAVERPSGASSV